MLVALGQTYECLDIGVDSQIKYSSKRCAIVW